MDIIERAARDIREEIVRQYRDDERGKCPAGSNFYEEDISPYLIARAVLSALREPDEGMSKAGGQEYAMTFQRPMMADTNARAIWQAMIDQAFREK